MADNTIFQQGKFTADGNSKVLAIRSDLDWMRVINYTQAATQQSTGRGIEFYWQRGMTTDTGIEYKKTNSTDALNMVTLTSGGFSLIDTSTNPVGTLYNTVTAISTASTPVVSSNTLGLSNGDVVRIIDVTSAQQLGGMDFTIGGSNPGTSFTLAYMAQLGLAGTTGSFRKINYDSIFYPRTRYITSVTSSGTSSVVVLSVTHGYTVGQNVKLNVPSAYGMVEADGLTGNITAINTGTNSITVDIDSSTFTSFAFPATAAVPFTFATVTPVGENVAYPDLNDDATTNTAYIGMKLAAGAQSPAGSTSDVIYWYAGKSFSVTNE
jgi:hypothetical protein